MKQRQKAITCSVSSSATSGISSASYISSGTASESETTIFESDFQKNRPNMHLPCYQCSSINENTAKKLCRYVIFQKYWIGKKCKMHILRKFLQLCPIRDHFIPPSNMDFVQNVVLLLLVFKYCRRVVSILLPKCVHNPGGSGFPAFLRFIVFLLFRWKLEGLVVYLYTFPYKFLRW